MRYLIRHGDTLSAIAQRNGVTVDHIMAANPQITNRDKIIAGKVINVPVPNGTGSLLQRIGDALFGRRR